MQVLLTMRLRRRRYILCFQPFHMLHSLIKKTHRIDFHSLVIMTCFSFNEQIQDKSVQLPAAVLFSEHWAAPAVALDPLSASEGQKLSGLSLPPAWPNAPQTLSSLHQYMPGSVLESEVIRKPKIIITWKTWRLNAIVYIFYSLALIIDRFI